MPATFSFNAKPVIGGHAIDLISSKIELFYARLNGHYGPDTFYDNPIDPPRLVTTSYGAHGYTYSGEFVILRSGYAIDWDIEWEAEWIENFIEEESLVRSVYADNGSFKIDLGRTVLFARLEDSKIGQLVRAGDNIVGSSGNDTLRTTNVLETIRAGAGDDRVEGRGGNDKIFGGPGDDLIFGGGGNDRITGEGGADIIYGGTGDDRFVFTGRTNSTPAVMDTLIDFDKSGNDVIDLAGIYGPKLAFIKGAAFTKIGQVRVNDVSGPDVVIEANVTGDLGVDFAIRIKATALAAMTPADFIL